MDRLTIRQCSIAWLTKWRSLGYGSYIRYLSETFLEYHYFHIYMRNAFSYKNLTSVTEQVIQLRNRTNVLLYYTADEPDGQEEPFSAPASAAAQINSLDPYRPSSLVLNCQDYFFSEYAAGTPVLMQDTYPIGINGTFSVVWNTSCTPDQGDCGCDNCVGEFEDIRNRMDGFATRREVLGWERSTTVWTVPQAFGGPGSRCVELCISALWVFTLCPGIGRVSPRVRSSWWK